MYQVSEAFAAAMKSRPYIARITLDGVDVIQGDTVKEIVFRSGANASQETVNLGCAVAGSVELTLDQTQVTCAIESRELFVELGLALESGKEWIPMGKYTAQDPVADDGVLTVTALDALGAKLDVQYEPLEGFDFSAGVASTAVLAALCARRGVEVNVDGLSDIVLQGSPEGFTERQIVGFIAALYGGFARMDRQGVLRICRYAEADVTVTADDYYEDGLEQATYAFQAGWLKCRNPGTNVTLVSGDPEAAQGFYLESLWMTQAILDGLYAGVMGVYTPVQKLSFLGDPRLDPGDIIQVQAPDGAAAVPVMTVSHEFDGGLITTVSAAGQAKTSEPTSPVMQAAKNAGKNLSQQEVFDKLTNGGQVQGLYMHNGQIYINAEYIQALEKMFAKNIVMTGTFESSGEDYLPPTYESVLYALLHVSDPVNFPLPAGYEDGYDVNGDGAVNRSDVEMMLDWYNGKIPVVDIPVRKKSTVHMRIDMSNTDALIHIWGTNQFGFDVEINIGANPATCSFARKEDVDRMIQQNVDEGILYRQPNGSDGETEYINPPMKVGVEYRTAERYSGKIAYTRLVSFGAMPSSGYAWKALDGIDITKVFKLEGRCSNGKEVNMFPVYMGGSLGAYCWVDESGIGVRAVQNMSEFSAEFVVWYYKD